MTLIFFLLGILTGLVTAFIIAQFVSGKNYKRSHDELIRFWKERNAQGEKINEALWEIHWDLVDLREKVDDRMIELWKERNEQGQQIIEALWEIRKVIIDLRG